MSQTNLAVVQEPKPPEVRFAEMVEHKMLSAMPKAPRLNDFQRRLLHNYYIAIERALATAEDARVKKNERMSSDKYRNLLPMDWSHIDLQALAIDVVTYVRMGLDPCQKNQLFVIPFKNNKTQKYTLNFMRGYIGLELVTMKYALDPPKAVTVELVRKNDVFKIVKRHDGQAGDSFEFDIPQPFDRGDIVGGFAYIQYIEPAKNKLIVMSYADIMKRAQAGQMNAEFWGGEKDEYKNGVKTGKKVKVDGWREEMCIKTIKRKVYGGTEIPLDPAKIDSDYYHMRQIEMDAEHAIIESQIAVEANSGDVIDINEFTIDTQTGEVVQEAQAIPEPAAASEIEIAEAEYYEEPETEGLDQVSLPWETDANPGY